jgi:protein TonB
MRDARATLRLLAFVAVSIATHAAVLLASSPRSATAPAPGTADLVLTISVVERGSSARPPTDSPTRTRVATRRAAPPSTPQVETPPAAADAERGETSAESNERPANTGSARAETHLWARTRIAEELSRYFTYPPLARSRGVEGIVILAYRVEADGRLDGIAVARSSGHALLDRAALSDLSRVPPLSDAGSRLQGAAVQDTLEVTYRLQNN